ncbi:metal ABC transporter solute-binding protein, Zn/Mn family [Microbacterium sp. RD1]|uniref:metal ABC transporter solute-binding protein, Zn/Mn family n=1 Tax=Microbacterium sp. RD1 TaxID=3457313 RepID=UPI003FA5F297
MTRSRLAAASALTAASVLVLAGCAGTSADADDGVLRIVASTNVYGQIAEEVGGDAVEVTSIIDSAAQDPHSFEPSAQDQLALSRADLIIENGGGYDGFVDALIESAGTDAPVLTAAEFSHDWPENAGHEAEEDGAHAADEDGAHAHGEGEHSDHEHVEGFNEHVWYDPHTMAHLAEGIAAELSELQPENADTFTANAEEFGSGVSDLEAALAEIAATNGGESVFATEPVPLYLVAAAGLTNVTPEAFLEAVEEGQDVPPATLLAALDLLDGGEVRAVLVNAQTGGAETTEVVADAEERGIPVVEFAETLPEGQTYLSWMDANTAALADALAR